jgi:hypothetical protein
MIVRAACREQERSTITMFIQSKMGSSPKRLPAPTRLPLSWTDEKWGEVEKATEEEVAKTHEEEAEKTKESLEVETTREEGAEETDNEMGLDAVLVDTLMNRLLAGVTPEMLEKASKTGILFNYDLDPKNPNSRKVDRETLKANQTVLSKILDLGPLTKSVYKKALTAYNAKIGMIIGKSANTLSDQSWSLKRMTMDVESIKKNSTTCSRLPPWLKSLVELWPTERETPLRTDVAIKEAASPKLKRTRSLFRIGSTPESVLRHRRKPSPLEGDTDADEDDGADKAVSENDSDKENKSEDESSDKPSKTAKKAKKEEDDDKYKEIGEYLRLNPKMRIDWDPVKKKGLLMTADGMIYSTREMMGPNGFVRCLFEETKHFWDSEIAFMDYEEDVVMKKPSKMMKGQAPKKIASPKRKPAAKPETPPTTPKKLAKHETPPKTPKPSKTKGAIYYEGEWIERSTIWKRVHSKAYHSSKTEAMGKGLKEDDVRKAIQKSVELAKHKFDKIFPP